MSELQMKKAGCCSLCDEPIMEVLRRVVDGPRKGDVAQFGGVLPGAKRTTLMLAGGSITHLSHCNKCAFTPENIQTAWWRMLLVAKAECDPEWRSLQRARPMTPQQREAAQGNLRRLLSNPPLGVLCTQTYAEIING